MSITRNGFIYIKANVCWLFGILDRIGIIYQSKKFLVQPVKKRKTVQPLGVLILVGG